jgi:DDE superfamily endonuclease
VRSAIQAISIITHQKIFIILPEAQDIVDVNIGEYGTKADITIFREAQIKFKSEQQFKGDKAFIGGRNISTPHKKPKKRELTEQQNEENKIFSSKRVFVEHLIRLVKIFRIAEQRFRLRFRNYMRVLSVVCGLIRLRIEALIL